MPGVGVRTAARLLSEVAGKHFETSGHLAAYAGLAPVTSRSGTSIRGERPSRRGNKILKRAMFLWAFAHFATQPHGPITTARLREENAATKPASPSPADAATSCSRRSATAPFINPNIAINPIIASRLD
jgi:transposase